MTPFSLNDGSRPHPKNYDGELIEITGKEGDLKCRLIYRGGQGGFEYTWMRCIAMMNPVSSWSITCGSNNDVDPHKVPFRRPSSPQTGSVHYCRL